MFKQSLPSVEQFAAYLDGNLSQSDMRHFSQMAEQDNVLRQLLDASTEIDNTLAGFTEYDLQIPSEIMGSDFELPMIPAEGVSPFVSLSQDSMDDMPAVAECADEDMSMYSETNQEEHLIAGNVIHDSSTLSMPNDDTFSDNIKDLSNSFSEDL